MPRRRKRRRGEGSIYRRADGYYVAAYVVGRDPNGRPKRKVIYGKSREAVEDALFTARNLVPDNPRITEYCDYWLRTVAEPKLRPTTYYEYHRVIEKHIKPFIGAYHLRDIDESKVERYLEALKGSTKSAVIQRLVLILLKRIFNHAVQNRIIQANPTRNISRPRYTTAIRRALTVQEVRRLLDVVKDDRYEAVYVLAVTAGMRIGEILALRWEDVDFDAGTIAIRRTIVEKGGKFMLGPPKTTKSFRTIYIPQIALNALRKRFSGQEGYVFPSRSGRPVLRTRFTNSEWSRVRKAAGLDGVVFHQLRHTAATLQLRAGTHPVVVQELLGHSSVSITLDVYSHATADLHRQSADRIDKMLEWPRYATNHATN